MSGGTAGGGGGGVSGRGPEAVNYGSVDGLMKGNYLVLNVVLTALQFYIRLHRG